MNSLPALSGTKERALELLGYGALPEQVAAACGVEASYISQLLSDEMFAAQVAELRFTHLSKHNARDSKYDRMEDELLDKLDTLKDLIHNPQMVLKALQILNAAKRRGSSTPQLIGAQQTVLSLTMPIAVVNKFTVNIHNQVVQAGDQELVTIQSSTLLDQVRNKVKDLPNGNKALPIKEGISVG
jgi:transcriptional regulator with XRE-family HTH domain